MKVVVNRVHGGFGVSLAAARRMAALGHRGAAEAVAKYDAKVSDSSLQSEIERKYGVEWYGGSVADGDGARADAVLVQVVQEMGDEADGSYSALEVVEIPDDVEWEIADYDGLEWIAEKHRTW